MPVCRLRGPICIGILLFAPAAWGNASIPYAKLMALPILFDALPTPQRDKLRLSVTVLHKFPSDHAPIHLWVVFEGNHAEIPLTADGVVTLSLQKQWVAREVSVETDQPKGSLDLAFNLAIQPPPAPPLTAGYLRDALAQAQFVINAGAHARVGFFAALFEPAVKGVKMKLAAQGQTARLVQGDRQAAFTQDGAGEVAMPTRSLDDFPEGRVTATSPVLGIAPWIE